MYGYLLHRCLCTKCVQCPRSPEESIVSPRTGVTGFCEQPKGCWELNSSPLEEQQVPLTTEPSRQSCKVVYNSFHNSSIITFILLDFFSKLFCLFYFSFIENRFFFHTIYFNYSFFSPNSSNTPPPPSESTSSLWLENKQASKE